MARSIVSIETGRNPRIRERVVGVLAAGEEMAAEPVPVRRPGVLVIGVEDLESGSVSWTGSQIGSTNTGSNLGRERCERWEWMGEGWHTGTLAIGFLSMRPS